MVTTEQDLKYNISVGDPEPELLSKLLFVDDPGVGCWAVGKVQTSFFDSNANTEDFFDQLV